MKTLAPLLLLLVCSCQTTFTGDAHFPGGSKGCATACQRESLEMGAFVLAGEYSSACVCVPKQKPGAPAAEGGLQAAATGVIAQMRRAQDAQRANQR